MAATIPSQPTKMFESTGLIEPGDEDDLMETVDSDVDEGLGTGTEVASSYQSEIFDFRYEHGRRYHGYRDGRYAVPNDEDEQNRLDIAHHICMMMLDGALHMVPFEKPPTRILDLGTGTGIWAIDMAMEYEAAEVIGTDLSPIQPEWVPQNCRFDIDDAEAEWVYDKNSLDFIHSRHFVTFIKDIPQLINRIYDHLKPGGWVQIMEQENQLRCDDGTYPKESALYRWWANFNEALTKVGTDPNISENIEGLIKNHGGFTDVRRISMKLPWGTWPKDKKNRDLGRWVTVALETGLEAYGMALFTRHLGMTVEESSKLFNDAKAELKSRNLHTYQFQHFVLARKAA